MGQCCGAQLRDAHELHDESAHPCGAGSKACTAAHVTERVFCMWTKSSSLMLSRIMVAVCLVALAACSLGLPWLLRWYTGYFGKAMYNLLPTMASLWACAASAFIALFQLGRMLRNIAEGRVFVGANVKALRVISWCCFAVALIFFAFFFYYVLGLILATLAAFAGLILRVVKNVFEQAVEIKEENDLTV